MDNIYRLLEYTSLFLFVVIAFAFGAIKSYLVNRGLIQWKLAYCNPFDFFEKYVRATKEETGKAGVWIKLMMYDGIGVFFVIATDILLRLILSH